MFPWFEPSTAPGKAEAMSALLARPGVADQVSKTGVRYVVWLDGSTRKTDGGGSLACGAAPGRGRLHRLRLVAEGIGLRSHHLGFETSQVRG